ncbi:MAG: AMP-dependent synthetase/ligase [Pirellulaceae bacterium]
MSFRFQTIPAFVQHQVETRPNAPAVSALDSERQTWFTRSWYQFASDISAIVRQLSSRIGIDDRVVSIAENSYAWMVTDLAIQICGGIHVPLHPQLTTEQLHELIDHSGAAAVVVSNAEQWGKVNARQKLAQCFSFSRELNECEHLPVGKIDLPPEVSDPLQLDLGRCRAESLVSILYTSGTTGQPKGVMVTQANVVANAYSKVATLPLAADDVRVCWLPMTHIFARVCDLFTAYLAGCHTVVSRGRDFLFEELREFQPTYLNAVPFFYERCYRKLKQTQLVTARDLQTLLGGQMKLCNCGGAPLAGEIFDFFRERQIELVTGYGLTESSPVLTSNRPGACKRGSVGQAIPEVEIRIAADGEVLARGPNVMVGYYRESAASQMTLRDGWLHTGDLGHLDDEGYLFLTGRKKDLIVTSGGKKIAPTNLENLLLAEPLFEQAIVVGDRRDFLIALLVINQVELARQGFAIAMDRSLPAIVLNDANLRNHVRIQVDRLLSGFSKYEQIVDFILLSQPFTTEDGSATAKGGLRRHIIVEKFADEINELYDNIERQRASDSR